MPHRLDSTNIPHLQIKNSICKNILFPQTVLSSIVRYSTLREQNFVILSQQCLTNSWRIKVSEICQVKTTRTPTKTEYLLDSKIYLKYKTKMVHLYVFIYENFCLFINIV